MSVVDVITIIVFLGMCILINCIWFRQCRRINNNWADCLSCINERIFELEKQVAELSKDKQEGGNDENQATSD